MTHLLSKSKYIRGLQCQRALYLDVYRPELGRLSKETRLKFIQGRQFESAYKALFPSAIDLSTELGRRIDSYPARTKQLLSLPGEVVLFEAGFLYGDVLVLADVVRKTDDGHLVVHEVKSGSVLSPTYRRDVALQHYVISHCVECIDEFSVVHNDGQGGFVVVDLLAEAREAMPEIEQNVALFKSMLQGSEPQVEMGDQCLSPYECPYRDYCSGRIPVQLEFSFD